MFLNSTKKHYFNSRPRKEVDAIPSVLLSLVVHFNSRPRKEVDPIDPKTKKPIEVFQLTTSQGGRPPCSLLG